MFDHQSPALRARSSQVLILLCGAEESLILKQLIETDNSMHMQNGHLSVDLFVAEIHTSVLRFLGKNETDTLDLFFQATEKVCFTQAL